jgi:hypothetical protein
VLLQQKYKPHELAQQNQGYACLCLLLLVFLPEMLQRPWLQVGFLNH